jgi:hypothetical protein
LSIAWVLSIAWILSIVWTLSMALGLAHAGAPSRATRTEDGIGPTACTEDVMKAQERLVVIGCGGVGAPAAVLSKKLMPEVDVSVIREEREFIVR